MKKIQGGVCAPLGYKANGVHCGVRKNKTKRDLSLIVSEVRAAAACVYTQNLVKGAPILVTKKHVADGYAQAIVCNSGNANTCNADGEQIAEGMCGLVQENAGVAAGDVIVASTGVIGQPLSLDPIAEGMPALVAGLSQDGSGLAAQGIMTTDTIPIRTVGPSLSHFSKAILGADGPPWSMVACSGRALRDNEACWSFDKSCGHWVPRGGR